MTPLAIGGDCPPVCAPTAAPISARLSDSKLEWWPPCCCASPLVLTLALAWSGDGACARKHKPYAPEEGAHRRAIKPPAGPPEIITDLARLPPLVASTRERILEAARSGDLQKLVTVMQSNETLPAFSLNDEKDPIAYWKANYPDSDGIEVLADPDRDPGNGLVHVDRGTPQEMYLWPYFARMPLATLTPATEGRIVQDCNRFGLQGHG